MAHVHGCLVISRPVEEVFDFVADECNEPSFNPAMKHVEKLTAGPVGMGSRYHATVMSMGRPIDMVIETTTYDRPRVLASITSMRLAQISGTLTLEPEGGRTRLTWDWDVAPIGGSRLMGPVIRIVGRRQEGRIWASLKDHLEAAACAT